MLRDFSSHHFRLNSRLAQFGGPKEGLSFVFSFLYLSLSHYMNLNPSTCIHVMNPNQAQNTVAGPLMSHFHDISNPQMGFLQV